MGNSTSLLDKLVERRDRDRKSLRGGDYVFRGSYGCTFGPPVGEEGAGAPGGSDRLGKVMNKTNAEHEYAIHQRMKAAAFYAQDWGVFADTPPARVKRDDAVRTAGGVAQITQCPLLKEWLDNPAPAPEDHLYQITMKKALGDLSVLDKYCKQPPTVANLQHHMRRLSNLYSGVQRMHAARMCHLDIKVNNVVLFGQSTDDPTTYKFIDFGMAKTFDEILSTTPAQQYQDDPASTSLNLRYFVYPLVANVRWTAVVTATGGKGLLPNYVFLDNPFRDHRKFVVDKLVPLLKQKTVYDAWWLPKFKSWSVMDVDDKSMCATYGSGAGGGEARLAAARATDVFALAQVTAFVFACMAHVVFTEDDAGNVKFEAAPEQEVIGGMLPGVQNVATALGVLLSDMIHMRIADKDVYDRYEAVYALMLRIPAIVIDLGFIRSPPNANPKKRKWNGIDVEDVE